MEKLSNMYLLYFKTALGLKKHHILEHIFEVTATPPLKYWADFLLYTNIIKIEEKTTHKIETLTDKYNLINEEYNIEE